MSTDTVRERLAMRGHARKILQELIEFMAAWGDFTGKHFPDERIITIKGTHVAQAEFAAVHKRLRELIDIRMPPEFRGADENQSIAAAIPRILDPLAKRKIVATAELDFLTSILEKPEHKTPIRWEPGKSIYSRHDPFDSAVRGVEAILEYMNLCAKYGPQHSVCAREGCGSFMVAGRGAKKFCSEDCRKRVWAYENKKDYYKAHRGNSRSSHGSKISKRKSGKKSR